MPKENKKRQFSGKDSTTSRIYLSYIQGSCCSFRMYVFSPKVQIVSTPQYDASCKERLDLHSEVSKLSSNCWEVSPICRQQVAAHALLLCKWLRTRSFEVLVSQYNFAPYLCPNCPAYN